MSSQGGGVGAATAAGGDNAPIRVVASGVSGEPGKIINQLVLNIFLKVYFMLFYFIFV